jgi:formate dehydrogenase major subunit
MGFAWPAYGRILYNRASARPSSERKKLVWWDAESKKWTGLDVPDFTLTKAPDYEPPAGAVGDDGLAADPNHSSYIVMASDGSGFR